MRRLALIHGAVVYLAAPGIVLRPFLDPADNTAVIGYWLVGLPAAGLLGLAAGVGPVGVWLGLMCGLAVTAALLLLRRFTTTLAQRRRQTASAPG